MKNFFYKYWVVYYIIFFFLLGILIYALIELKTNNDLYNRLDQMNEKVNNCCEAKNNITDDIADDIERIKDNNGGIGELTVTLIWNTIDDLDLGLREPSGKFIYYKEFSRNTDRKISPDGGQLDIDMNAADYSMEPVENINYVNNIVNGSYHVYVNLYESRSGQPVEYQLIIRKNQKIIHSQIGTSQTQGKQEKIISFKI